MKMKFVISSLFMLVLLVGFSSQANARWFHRHGHWHRYHRSIRIFRHEHITRHRVYDYDAHYHGYRHHGHRHHHYRFYRD